MSQSSNDTFPTATHIAATEAAVRHLIPALEVLHESLAGKARQWRTVVKSGRTHLMDAVPVTLGQEFSGYARQVEAGIERVKATLPRLGELAIGGTAVGTGLERARRLRRPRWSTCSRSRPGWPNCARPSTHFEAQAARDGLVEASGALRTIAVSLTKIANDIRWMGSGPLTGLGEIQLPDLQPGSSIMPGKVNPGSPRGGYAGGRAGDRQRRRDRVGWRQRRVRAQRLHPDDGAQHAGVVQDPDERVQAVRRACIDGLVANEERLRELAESSPSIVTPLNSAIGYEEAAAVAKQALKEKKTIRQTVIDRGLIGDKLSEEELDKRLDVLAMAKVKDGD